MIDFLIREEFIPLSAMLKATGIAGTGGHAKVMILEGEVKVNDEVESRIRRKLRSGDVVDVEGARVKIITADK